MLTDNATTAKPSSGYKGANLQYCQITGDKMDNGRRNALLDGDILKLKPIQGPDWPDIGKSIVLKLKSGLTVASIAGYATYGLALSFLNEFYEPMVVRFEDIIEAWAIECYWRDENQFSNLKIAA